MSVDPQQHLVVMTAALLLSPGINNLHQAVETSAMTQRMRSERITEMNVRKKVLRCSSMSLLVGAPFGLLVVHHLLSLSQRAFCLDIEVFGIRC